MIPTGGRVDAAALGAPGAALADFGTTLADVAGQAAERRRLAIKEEQARLQRIADATGLGEGQAKAPRIGAETVARWRKERDRADPSYTDDLLEELDGRLGTLREEIIGEQDGRRLLSDGAVVRLNGIFESVKTSAFEEALRDQGKGMTDKALDTAAEGRLSAAAGVVATPESFEAALAMGPLAVLPLADALTANQERDEIAAWRRAVIAGKIRGEIDLGNFAGARDVLADERYFADLPGDQRQTLSAAIDTAEDARNERVEKVRRDAEAVAKESREQTAAALTLGIAEGATTEGKLIEALRGRLIDRSQFNQLSNALASGQEGADHPVAALALRADALDGRAGVVEILNSHAAGEITLGTAEELLGVADQVSRRGGVLARADVRGARAIVDQTIGGVRAPLAVLDSAASERTQNALREFDARIRQAGDKGAPFEPFAIADEVVEAYRLTPPSPTAFRKPKYLVGTRAKPNVDETMRRTLGALDNGLITPEEAMEELRNLDRIEDALAQRETTTE